MSTVEFQMLNVKGQKKKVKYQMSIRLNLLMQCIPEFTWDHFEYFNQFQHVQCSASWNDETIFIFLLSLCQKSYFHKLDIIGTNSCQKWQLMQQQVDGNVCLQISVINPQSTIGFLKVILKLQPMGRQQFSSQDCQKPLFLKYLYFGNSIGTTLFVIKPSMSS